MLASFDGRKRGPHKPTGCYFIRAGQLHGIEPRQMLRLIGQAAYEARVLDVIRQFGCPRFAATLAVHGRAVMAGEIVR